MENTDWITVTEAIGISGYNRDHFRELLRDGHIKGKKVATVWLVNRDSLLSYIQRMSQYGKRGPKKK